MKRLSLAASPLRLGRHLPKMLAGFIAIALLLALASSGRAADTVYTWDASGAATVTPTDGSGTWSTSNSNWFNSGSDSTWPGSNSTNGATLEAYIGTSNTAAAYTITLGSQVYVNEIFFGATGSSLTYTIAGDSNGDSINLDGTSPTIDVNNNAATATISAPLAGSGGLNKTGNGGLILSGSDTYSGNTTITAGSLSSGVTNALPTTTALAVNVAGTTYNLRGVNQTVGALSSASGSSIRNSSSGTTATLTIGSGGSSGASSLLAGDVRDGNIGEIFNLTLNDSNTVETVTGANNYSGATTINLGTLIITSDSNIGGNAGVVQVTTSGTGNKTVTVPISGGSNLFSANTQAIGVGTSILGTTVASTSSTTQFTLAQNASSAEVTTGVNYATAGNLDLNGGILEANATFSLSESSSSGLGGTATVNRAVIIGSGDTGTIDVTSGHTLTVPGIISGGGSPGGLTKTDTGTLLLSGANTYTGATTISAGTLNLTGSLNTATTVSVAAGAQFALGTSGESSPVSQTVASLTLNSTGTTPSTEAQLSFNLGATTSDSLTTTGALTLSGSKFDLVLTDTTLPTGSETLLTWATGGITTSEIDLTGSSANITASDLSVQGDSLIFSASAVPEPGTDALLLCGVAALLAFHPRRRPATV